MFEVGGGVVAGAVVELDVWPVDLDGEMTEGAVAGDVGGAEAEDVVGLGVVLHLREGGGEGG